MRQTYIAALAIAALTTAAQAEFRVSQTAPDSGAGTAASVAESSVVGEIGERPERLPKTTTEGKGVSAGNALKAIAPKGWQGFSKNADLAKQVSWERGVEWTEALAAAMRTSGNRAVVDWEKKRITVFPDTRKTVIAQKTDPAKITEPIMKKTLSATTAIPAKWVLRSGRRIDSELAEWAKNAGWQLDWNVGTTWEVPAETSFSGSFEDAMQKVVESLYADGQPIHMKVYEGNRLMEVTYHAPR